MKHCVSCLINSSKRLIHEVNVINVGHQKDSEDSYLGTSQTITGLALSTNCFWELTSPPIIFLTQTDLFFNAIF